MNRFFDSIDFGKLAVYVWVGFTTLYFLVSVSVPFLVQRTQASLLQNAQIQGYNTAMNQAMQTFSGNVYQNGYNTAFLQLGEALSKQMTDGCKDAVPLNVGGSGAIGILSTACLQQSAPAEQTPAQDK